MAGDGAGAIWWWGRGREGRARVVVSVDLTDAAGRNGKARDGASTDTRDAFGSGTHRRWRAETPLRRRLGRLCTPGATRGPTRTPSRRDPLGTRRQCGTRRPKSVIHDRPSERLAAGRSVASRRARLRTRWTLRPTADGAGCSARVRSSSLTIAARTRGRQSRLNQKRHREEPNGPRRPGRNLHLWNPATSSCWCCPLPRKMSSRRLSASSLLFGSPAARTTVAATMETDRAPVKFAVIGDALVDITVGASSRFRPDRSSRSVVIVLSARTSPPRRLRPRASPPPPLPLTHPPSHSSHPSQALWTRCPSPAWTSRWTR